MRVESGSLYHAFCRGSPITSNAPFPQNKNILLTAGHLEFGPLFQWGSFWFFKTCSPVVERRILSCHQSVISRFPDMGMQSGSLYHAFCLGSPITSKNKIKPLKKKNDSSDIRS